MLIRYVFFPLMLQFTLAVEFDNSIFLSKLPQSNELLLFSDIVKCLLAIKVFYFCAVRRTRRAEHMLLSEREWRSRIRLRRLWQSHVLIAESRNLSMRLSIFKDLAMLDSKLFSRQTNKSLWEFILGLVLPMIFLQIMSMKLINFY